MEEDEYLKLPVEDRCGHKLWKARVSGYEEAIKHFARWDGDDPNWKKVIKINYLDCKIEINVSHFCFIVHWTNEEIHH